MTISFRGGFLRPIDISDSTITSTRSSDTSKVYVVKDDNSTYKSKLFPILTKVDNTASCNDVITLKIYYDKTTEYMEGTGYIDPPPDDFHPSYSTEYITSREQDNTRRVATFIYKPDSTSKWKGMDRFDNLIPYVIPNYAWKFYWYQPTGYNSWKTWSGGDLYATRNSMHMSFLYVVANDGLSYIANLCYSRFSDTDGTFLEPVVLERNIDIGGYGNPNDGGSLVDGINRKTNPRFLGIPGKGLALFYMKSIYSKAELTTTNTDSTNFYMNVLLTEDDGTNWSLFSQFELKFYNRSPIYEMRGINEIHPPYFHWTFAENKVVGISCFRDYSGTFENAKNFFYRSHINVYVSEDLAKTFTQMSLDLSKVLGGITDTNFYNIDLEYVSIVDACIHYDKRISKWIITVVACGRTSCIFFIVNTDESLKTWRVTQSVGLCYDHVAAPAVYAKLLDTSKDRVASVLTFPTEVLENQTQKLVPYVDSNDNCYIAMNGMMLFRDDMDHISEGTTAVTCADYIPGNYPFIKNPVLCPVDLIPSTDESLDQYQFPKFPWKSRKLKYDVILGRDTSLPENTDLADHRNGSLKANGVEQMGGSVLSTFMDGIGFSMAEESSVGDSNSTGVRCKFGVQSVTSYKNRMFVLATTTHSRAHLDDKYFDYQVPVILYNPGWSNVNIKPRKSHYYFPTRYPDQTYNGYVRLNQLVLESIELDYTEVDTKFWETRFFRNDHNSSAVYSCGLKHVSNPGIALEDIGYRGSQWDTDSTRGVFSHFCCSRSSEYNDDVTSLVHFQAVSNTNCPTANSPNDVSTIETFVGLDFIGFRSCGSTITRNWETFPFINETTRDMEFLVVNNRYNNQNAAHEHRAFFKYHNARDWTLLYYYQCDVGTYVDNMNGVGFGNILRWPYDEENLLQNAIYFKYVIEGWSALGMQEMSTSNGDNKDAVLPQCCTQSEIALESGFRVAWCGQDATANAQFLISPDTYKNTPAKMLNGRPGITWLTSSDTSGSPIIDIDFGKSIEFDTVAIYDTNVNSCVMRFGQENNSTDLTSFLILLRNMDPAVSTSDYTMYLEDISTVYCDSGSYRPWGIGRNSLTIDCSSTYANGIEYTFATISQNIDLKGRDIQLYNDNYVVTFCRRIKNIRTVDQTCFVELIQSDSTGLDVTVPTDLSDSGVNLFDYVYLLHNNISYKLNKKVTARYIRLDNFEVSTPLYQTNFEDRYKIGMLSFGNYIENESPIHYSSTEQIQSGSKLESSISGTIVSILSSKNKKIFTVNFECELYGRDSQFENIESFLNDVYYGKESFYFYPKGMPGNRISYADYLPIYKSANFYFVRLANKPSIQKIGNVAKISLTLEEVL